MAGEQTLLYPLQVGQDMQLHFVRSCAVCTIGNVASDWRGKGFTCTKTWCKYSIAAGLYAATMTASAIYGANNGVSYNSSFYNNMAVTATNLYRTIYGTALYFQFKYAREQEIESDLIAYRFCEAIGIGGYAYIMALQLLDENDLYMRVDKTDNHPTLGYRIAFLKYIYSMEHSNR